MNTSSKKALEDLNQKVQNLLRQKLDSAESLKITEPKDVVFFEALLSFHPENYNLISD